jgi:hypothetical protein
MCGDVTAPRGTGTLFCIGNSNGPQRWTDPDVGDHPCEEMDRVRVFAEEDVRPLWEAVDQQRRWGDDTPAAHENEAFDNFPAPAEWS